MTATTDGGFADGPARNIVIVVLDAVRKDAFDMFAPQLRARADVSFVGCRAASSWSTPSHASMVTGQLPHQHGIHTYQRSFSSLAPKDTFLGQLRDRGYDTVGVTQNFYAGSAFGFDGLFDEFVDVDPEVRYPGAWTDLDADGPAKYLEALWRAARSGTPLRYLGNGVAALLRGRFDTLPVPSPYGDATPTRRAIHDRVANATEPVCCFANFMDAHQPLFPHVGLDGSLHGVPNDWTSKDGFYDVKWDVNARGTVERHHDFLTNYRALYAATVGYLDRQVTALIDTIDRVTDRETTYVVTSDHGENLAFDADGGTFEHTGTLTEAALHVPLSVVNAPDGYPEQVTGYASHLRLGELVTGLAAGETPDITADRIPAEVVGLSPGTTGLADEERDALERMRRAVYEPGRKVVWDSDGRVDEYRLDPARPCWQAAVEHDGLVPDWANTFFDSDIESSLAAAAEHGTGSHSDLENDAKDRLEDLGYL